MSALFLWFYCLDISQALALAVSGIWIVLVLHRRYCGSRAWRAVLAALFVLILLGILSQTVLLREPGTPQTGWLPPFASYETLWAEGNREILRTNLMNVLLFCPLGLFGSLLWGRSPRLWQVLLVAAGLFAFSCGIEWVQLVTARGLCEADDVLHNTLGALCGGLTAWIGGRITTTPEPQKPC